jgi:5'-methylthioadenosine phosphorylase
MTGPHPPRAPLAEIGVIGGSGMYALLEHAEQVPVETPYGPPSDPLVVGEVGGRRVAFVPRHGVDHRFPPHRIPYRANLWALRSIGVRQVVAPCAVGSLRPELGPGSLVVCDQLVDRTSGREHTYYDGEAVRGAVHVPFAEPYCPTGRATAVRLARDAGWPVTDGGTMVVVEGPRFSTRAESRWFAAQGWSVVNMTGHPEAVLARELALCYTALALVTDLDAGVEGSTGVTQDEVFAVFQSRTADLRALLLDVVAALPVERTCACGSALAGTGAQGWLP